MVSSRQEFFHEVRAHARFPVKLHLGFPTGTVPANYNPLNQTQSKGNFPEDQNPTRFLRQSFESKGALVGPFNFLIPNGKTICVSFERSICILPMLYNFLVAITFFSSL